MSPRLVHLLAASGAVACLVLTHTTRVSGLCTPSTITSPLGNAASADIALSADGRYLAFSSTSTDLVAGDTNGVTDVFVYDRQTCTSERISVDSSETQGNLGSFGPAVSSDGRYVSFASDATNLVAGDTNGFRDIFLRDRTLGTTERVSVTSAEAEVAGVSFAAILSGDGHFVAFVSLASGLVAGDTNNEDDVFVRDVVAGTTERVSVGTGGVQGESPADAGVENYWPAISSDGRYIAFATEMNNLVASDTNAALDVFLRDRQSGTTTLVSVSTGGAVGNLRSLTPSMSGDGRYISFTSNATDLITGDTNLVEDIFVRDMVAGTTTRVSLVNRGGEANNHSATSSISADGRYVAFASSASNLVLGDDEVTDIFVHDRMTGLTRLASAYETGVPSGFSGLASANPDISDNGQFVGFHTAANLAPGDGDGLVDVFSVEWQLVPPVPVTNLLLNGDFTSGTANWLLFATPDMSYITWQIVNGVFEYFRVPPPPGTSNQAVVFQQTTAYLPAQTGLVADFDIGNSSSVRKRISVLIHDSNFSDLFVCTFWLAPNAPMRSYRMQTHTTKAWADATISFYAATAGSNGGYYQLDNVSLAYQPAYPNNATYCVDPTKPAPPGGPDSANLLGNGDFSTGMLPPWGVFGQIVYQIAGGVFEFIRPAGVPAGVVLQGTGQPMPAGQILGATFDLGNSSTVRKRVTILIHDGDFSDLHACTFWLPPMTLLSTFYMGSFTTEAWTNATLSVYPATVGTDQWIRLDNVILQTTPSLDLNAITVCLEPGAFLVAPARSVRTSMTVMGPPSGRPARPRSSAHSGPVEGSRISSEPPATLAQEAPVFIVTSPATRVQVWVPPSDAQVDIQVSIDGVEWQTIATAPGASDWSTVDLDLTEFPPPGVYVRAVSAEPTGR